MDLSERSLIRSRLTENEHSPTTSLATEPQGEEACPPPGTTACPRGAARQHHPFLTQE